LIELLIVVAIIAILAAIAVPNFLEAQVRAKVSRCRSDMRTIVTALESYRVDNTRYPPMADINVNPSPTGTGFHSRTPSYLTTPIAYITSLPLDPFVSQKVTFTSAVYPASSEVGKRYVYYETVSLAAAYPNPWGLNDLPGWTGQWLMYGYGPDGTPLQGTGATLVPYDPTNGTISTGNVVRCQENNETTPVNPRTGTFNF
jgi:type II secretory pathway pseudopilin PulG